jgi:uncharacterized membrane protein
MTTHNHSSTPGPRIWQVGNWCAHWGNEFRESAFRSSIKDFEVLNYARFLTTALEKIPGAVVDAIPSWELYRMSPEQFDAKLKWADVIIFGDVETQSLHLNPAFFANQFDRKYVTFPDRFDLLKNWISEGGHFHMNGGWFSYGGHQGYGRWGRCSWQKDTDERVLAVDCLETDDLIESTASFEVRTSDDSHPAVQGIDWSTVPPILGFNETLPGPGGNVIAEIRNGNAWYPLLAERKVGKGRSTAWTTSASPHWGVNFMKWEHYDRFWAQLFAPAPLVGAKRHDSPIVKNDEPVGVAE